MDTMMAGHLFFVSFCSAPCTFLCAAVKERGVSRVYILGWCSELGGGTRELRGGDLGSNPGSCMTCVTSLVTQPV